MGFQKATKKQAKLRLAIFGPSGAGKTFTCLRIAAGIGGKIAFIDSERGSASKYSDRFDFDVVDLEGKSISEYVKWIKEANKAGYDVLIIDSITHAWQELLDEIDKLAKGKYKGNTWSAWSEGTPKQKELIDAILSYKGHVIVTMRSKTEWGVQTDNNGKVKPTRIGLTPEQGKGIEYEFDILMEITPEHIANIIKDRTGKYQDELITMPGEEFGKQLADWLSTGETLPQNSPVQNTQGNNSQGKGSAENKTNPELEKKHKRLHVIGVECYAENWDPKRKEQVKAVTKGRTESSKELTEKELDQLISHLEKNKEKIKQANASATAGASTANGPNTGQGTVDTQKSLYETLMQKINAVDTIIDLIQFVQQETKMIDLLTEETYVTDLTVALNGKAQFFGVDISKVRSAA